MFTASPRHRDLSLKNLRTLPRNKVIKHIGNETRTVTPHTTSKVFAHLPVRMCNPETYAPYKRHIGQSRPGGESIREAEVQLANQLD